ncbi:MAG: CPBP family glutamic-type intramembrane protease [Bacillota bacterium]
MHRKRARWLRHPAIRARAVLAALLFLTVVCGVGAGPALIVPASTAQAASLPLPLAAPVVPDGTVFAGRFLVDYVGVDEAAARQVLEAGAPIMDGMNRLMRDPQGDPDTPSRTVRILIGPASEVARTALPPSDGGVLALRRSGAGWAFSNEALAVLMAQVYLRPQAGPASSSVWSDGLAVLADPASVLPLPGYRRPTDDAAFIEDLRTFARDLDLISELKIRQTEDFFGAFSDTRFYRYQAAALVASVIQSGHAPALLTLSQLSDIIQTSRNYPYIKTAAHRLGLTEQGLDPDSISAAYLEWLKGADPTRLGNSVTTAVRRGQTMVFSFSLAGIALAAALIAAAAFGSGRGLGGSGRLGLFARTLGLYALAAMGEYWVGVVGPGAGSALNAGQTTPLKNLFELALIALAALAIRREARRRASGPPGALREDSYPRTALMVFGLFAAIMAVRLAVYSEDHLIFGKATTILLVVLWLLRYERARLTEVGLTFRRLGAQLAVGFVALLLYRVLEIAASVITPFVLGSHPAGVQVLWMEPTLFWVAISFLYGNFAEELFFRGYVQAKLDRAARTRADLALAIGFQALLFGLFHVNYDLFPFHPLDLVWYVIFAATFGVIMGLTYRATGSVAVVAVAHPLWNMRVLNVSIWAANALPAYSLVYYPLLVILALLIVPPVMKRVMAAFGEVSFRDPAPALLKEGQTGLPLASLAQMAAALRALPARLRARLTALRADLRTAIHDASRWPLERRLLTALSGLSAILLLLMLTVIPVSGRVVLLTVVVVFAAAFGAMAYTRSRFKETLADLAKEMEFTHVARPQDEVGDPLISGLHWSYPPDIYDLKIEGGYPYVVGRYRDFTVMVRRPRAVEFELDAPDTTRVAIYHRSHVEGLAVYSVRRYPRTLRLTPTGDEEFDRRFKVQGRDLTELKAILNHDVRRRLVALDRVGVTGVTINPQGLFFYEPGLVTNAADLRDILELLAAMAAGVAGLSRPGADRLSTGGPK